MLSWKPVRDVPSGKRKSWYGTEALCASGQSEEQVTRGEDGSDGSLAYVSSRTWSSGIETTLRGTACQLDLEGAGESQTHEKFFVPRPS